MPQDQTINPILDAAKRELSDRAKAVTPLRTANDAYNGPARIVSINTSPHKGTRKAPVADGHDTVIAQFGLASDAHAGHWHRQVSFLAAESIQTARARGLDVHEGDFGENFTTQGINLLFFLPTAISALLCHWQKGYLDTPTWKAAVPVAVPAALAGAWIATAVDVDLLRRPFGIYLLLSGLSLIFPQKDHKTPGG